MGKIIDAIHTLSTLEELAAGKSYIHRIHPSVKLIITFIYLIAVLSPGRHNLSPLLGLCLYPAVLIPLAEIPFGAIFKRVCIALPFSLFAGISNLIFERDIAFTVIGIPITDGMISFTTLMLKTFLCVSAVLLLIATTSSFRLFTQLRAFHVPKVLVLTLMMTYRYIFLLLEEASDMTRAYHLRAPDKKGIQMKDMGSFLGQLLLRCFDRSERVYAAMECRGFTGEYYEGSDEEIEVTDITICTVAAVIIIALRIFPIASILAIVLI